MLSIVSGNVVEFIYFKVLITKYLGRMKTFRWPSLNHTHRTGEEKDPDDPIYETVFSNWQSIHEMRSVRPAFESFSAGIVEKPQPS